MKATADAASLAKALDAVSPSAASSVSPPAGTARIKIVKKKAAVQAKGLDAMATVGFDGEGDMNVIVPAKRVGSMLGAVEGTVDLSVDDEGLLIVSDLAEFRIKTVPAEAHAEVPVLKAEKVAIDGFDGIDSIAYALSKDPQRPTFQSLAFVDGWAYATDSKRIAAVRFDWTEDDTLVSGDLIRQATAVTGGVTDIGVQDNALYAFGPNGWMRGPLINLAIPPFAQQLSLPEFSTVGSFAVDDLMAGVRIVKTAIESSREARPQIRLTPEGGALTLAAGQADGEFQALASVGFDLAIKPCVFDVNYLIDMLGQFAGEEVFWHERLAGSTTFVALSRSEVIAESTEFGFAVPLRLTA